MKIKAWTLLIFFSLIIFSSLVLAQNISIDIQGACRKFNVTLTADMPAGCYDVKIDITTSDGRVGQIYDQREGWKSSIYYIDDALCIEDGNATKTFALRADSGFTQLYFQPKLRSGSDVWEGNYTEFTQTCPALSDDTNKLIILVALIVVLVLLVAITLYLKIWKM